MADPLYKLVDELIEAFPDRYPPLTLTDRELGFRAGQVDICRRLRTVREAVPRARDLSLLPDLH